ncbi:helix-turn-helix domain-containing protein [Synoicihabitans lomoniglobus]|uniref:Leucine zipper domain-containing protein n=1 Tax=Synoicihabitans lomoniglobus TaxID=2909285 RepID=A0AAF0CQ29_9BACT|nr:helix-turn-helix domain-containing protein [Opitutaceae bacterium LMO-M01]WED65949.1 leucine zipper domain-containing protein [Opitutaceae bacterium LMO-M01]
MKARTFPPSTLGRRTSRILPAAAESLDYVEWGNLWHRTDFNGHTTTFGYDSLNRLKTKTADATHPSLTYAHAIARFEYDYDANGARVAVRTHSDLSTINLSYDADGIRRQETIINSVGTVERTTSYLVNPFRIRGRTDAYPMDHMMQFVNLAAADRFTVSPLCENFDISRKSGHKWLSRYAARGADGLRDLSRRGEAVPIRPPRRWWL